MHSNTFRYESFSKCVRPCHKNKNGRYTCLGNLRWCYVIYRNYFSITYTFTIAMFTMSAVKKWKTKTMVYVVYIICNIEMLSDTFTSPEVVQLYSQILKQFTEPPPHPMGSSWKFSNFSNYCYMLPMWRLWITDFATTLVTTYMFFFCVRYLIALYFGKKPIL